MDELNESLAQIQIQDISGRWFTVSSVKNTDQIVAMALNSAERTYKGKRVRAVTPKGSILDIR